MSTLEYCSAWKNLRNWKEDTCFVLQKDFSKSPSKIAGLLTAKFPSGLRGALMLVRHPVSANFPLGRLGGAGRRPESF